MQAITYAIEHLITPRPSRVFSQLHSLFVVAAALWKAALTAPCDRCLCSGSSDSVSFVFAGASKFAGFLRLNCRRTRSRVLGMMNVAFRSYSHCQHCATQRARCKQRPGRYLTLRFEILGYLRSRGVDGPAADGELMLPDALPES